MNSQRTTGAKAARVTAASAAAANQSRRVASKLVGGSARRTESASTRAGGPPVSRKADRRLAAVCARLRSAFDDGDDMTTIGTAGSSTRVRPPAGRNRSYQKLLGW